MTKTTDTKALREGSKAATLLDMLQRKDGATLDEMTERTGWQSHSVRAAMTGLRKMGYSIERGTVGNMTAWFIGAAA